MTQLSSGGTQRCLLFPIVHGHGWKSLRLKQHSLLFRSHLYLVKWAKTYRASTFADDVGLEITEPGHLIEGKGVTETQKKKKNAHLIPSLHSSIQKDVSRARYVGGTGPGNEWTISMKNTALYLHGACILVGEPDGNMQGHRLQAVMWLLHNTNTA